MCSLEYSKTSESPGKHGHCAQARTASVSARKYPCTAHCDDRTMAMHFKTSVGLVNCRRDPSPTSVPSCRTRWSPIVPGTATNALEPDCPRHCHQCSGALSSQALPPREEVCSCVQHSQVSSQTCALCMFPLRASQSLPLGLPECSGRSQAALGSRNFTLLAL